MIENTAWALTALGAVIIVLTRLRLADPQRAAGNAVISNELVNLHTGVGAGALVVWISYLLTSRSLFAYPSLLLWWIEVLIGFAILLRWLPSNGSHIDTQETDQWSNGPALSMVAHLGLAGGVTLMTVWYVMGLI